MLALVVVGGLLYGVWSVSGSASDHLKSAKCNEGLLVFLITGERNEDILLCSQAVQETLDRKGMK